VHTRIIRLFGLAAVLSLAACGSSPTAPGTAPQTLPPLVAPGGDPLAAGLVASERAALEQTAEATRYTIDLHLADDLRSLTGSQRVLYTNQETVALDSLVMRLFPGLIGGTAEVSSVRIGETPADFALELGGSVLRVPLDPALQPGGQLEISLEFEVAVPQDSQSGYGLLTLSDGILSLSHFYPMIAVYDDEGWNIEDPPDHADIVYADVAYFEVTLDAPADLILAGAGLQTARSLEGGRQRSTFIAGPVRDFHLAGSSDFEAHSLTLGETTLVSYTLPAYASASDSVLEYASAAVTFFNHLLGPYPYTELDLVSIPIDAMGVEYPGIISLNLAFYDPQDDTFPQGWFESVVTHEVAHQWVYGTVGNDQLDDPWLDESLAQYLTLRYFADRYGPQGADGYRQAMVERWERVERAPIPIGLPVRDYTPLEYGAIVYGRGGLFFEALAEALGQPAMDEFLQEYYQTQRWGIATPESLQALAEAHCGCDLEALFREWVTAD